MLLFLVVFVSLFVWFCFVCVFWFFFRTVLGDGKGEGGPQNFPSYWNEVNDLLDLQKVCLADVILLCLFGQFCVFKS